MTQLLVSVRSAEEARSALEGGASVIDVKEPARGALGRADDAVIAAIVAEIDGRRPVSAALGEWSDGATTFPDADLAYVKWGLAGCAGDLHWRRDLARMLDRSNPPQVVLTAYADYECAQAPSVDEVLSLASNFPGSVLLVDTHCKEAGVVHKRRPTLLDWLPAPWVEDLCTRCRAAKVKIALAGSLGVAEIRSLIHVRPDWFAVRGAVCGDGDRQATVQTAKVRQILEMLA